MNTSSETANDAAKQVVHSQNYDEDATLASKGADGPSHSAANAMAPSHCENQEN